MKIKDKLGDEYDYELMQQNSPEQAFVTKKINALWEHTNEKFVANCLTTKYSPDGIPKTYIIKKENKVIGFCSLLRNDVMFRTDITPWFGNCYVQKEYRRRGLMTFMQNFICKEAKQMNYKKIFLWSSNQKLYIKTGWKYLEKVMVNEKKTANLFYKDIF